MGSIAYKAGYKYQLTETATFATGIAPPRPITTERIDLDARGNLTVREGYAWDGPSGPTVDRRTNMRGSLPHDCGYQLIRMGLLPESYRAKFDDLLLRLWLEDGMWPWLAKVEVRLVKAFAESASEPSHRKPVLHAP